MNLIPRDSLFDFDQLFNHFYTPSARKELEHGFFSPRVDIKEKDDHYEITAELAGVKKDDISVTLDNGILTLSAKTDQESTEEKDGKIIRKERRTGNYMRSFTLGNNIQQSDINASFTDGLLRLEIPKKEEVKQVNRSIEIS